MRHNEYEYDAFISHAVEDKIPVANELCARLERAGLKIWYSGKELGIGDSIEKTIEKGLKRSRYGVVVFSPTYLAKNWTIREFYTLLAKEIEEQKVILPVLYNVTLDDLKKKDLVMADRFGVSTEKGIDFVVDKLVKEIRRASKPAPRLAWLSRVWAALILSLVVNIAFVARNLIPEVHQQPPSRATPTLFSQYQAGGVQLTNGAGCQCNNVVDRYARAFMNGRTHPPSKVTVSFEWPSETASPLAEKNLSSRNCSGRTHEDRMTREISVAELLPEIAQRSSYLEQISD